MLFLERMHASDRDFKTKQVNNFVVDVKVVTPDILN